jgi:hypothetical protein
MKHGPALVASVALAFAAACGGATVGGVENGDSGGGDSGGHNNGGNNGSTEAGGGSVSPEPGPGGPVPSGPDGGTWTVDASVPPSGDDGGIGPGPGPRGCFSSGNSCQCESMENGHDYVVWCNNTSCICSLDGNTTKTLASAQVCNGGPGGLDTAWTDCGFPR